MIAQLTVDRSSGDGARRDFLYVSAATMAAVGGAAALWPFIDTLNPSQDVTALSSVELDLTPIELGQRVTVKWRGRPVFIERRTQAQIDRARADDRADLPDPEFDAARVQQAEWLIVVGVCTHLGCVPLGQARFSPRGDWGGWFCPCHGSHYDVSGRVRKGPAPRNLDVPSYAFLEDGRVHIG